MGRLVSKIGYSLLVDLMSGNFSGKLGSPQSHHDASLCEKLSHDGDIYKDLYLLRDHQVPSSYSPPHWLTSFSSLGMDGTSCQMVQNQLNSSLNDREKDQLAKTEKTPNIDPHSRWLPSIQKPNAPSQAEHTDNRLGSVDAKWRQANGEKNEKEEKEGIESSHNVEKYNPSLLDHNGLVFSSNLSIEPPSVISSSHLDKKGSSVPLVGKESTRVKFFSTNVNREWDDLGTGNLYIKWPSQDQIQVEGEIWTCEKGDDLEPRAIFMRPIFLVVSEKDQSTLLEVCIPPYESFQLEQESILSWHKDADHQSEAKDYALSFQYPQECSTIRKKISDWYLFNNFKPQLNSTTLFTKSRKRPRSSLEYHDLDNIQEEGEDEDNQNLCKLKNTGLGLENDYLDLISEFDQVRHQQDKDSDLDPFDPRFKYDIHLSLSLPPATPKNLDEILKLLMNSSSFPKKHQLSRWIITSDYLSELCDLFKITEDLHLIDEAMEDNQGSVEGTALDHLPKDENDNVIIQSSPSKSSLTYKNTNINLTALPNPKYDELYKLNEIFKSIIMLNDPALIDLLFQPQYIFQVVGALEYDASLSKPSQYRQLLRQHHIFQKVIDLPSQLRQEIQHVARLQYIKDILSRVIDESTLINICALIKAKYSEIINCIIRSDKMIVELLEKIRLIIIEIGDSRHEVHSIVIRENKQKESNSLDQVGDQAGDQFGIQDKEKELGLERALRFLYELCDAGKQLDVKDQYRIHVQIKRYGFFNILQFILMKCPSFNIRRLVIELLVMSTEYHAFMLHQFITIQDQRIKNKATCTNLLPELTSKPMDGSLIELMIEIFHQDKRIIIINLITDWFKLLLQVNIQDLQFPSEFLHIFYKRYINKLMAISIFNQTAATGTGTESQTEAEEKKEEIETIKTKPVHFDQGTCYTGLAPGEDYEECEKLLKYNMLELLNFFFNCHPSQMVSFLIRSHLLVTICQVFLVTQCRAKHLQLSVIRLLGQCVMSKKKTIYQHLIQYHLLDLAMDLFLSHREKYNLVNSATLGLFTCIKKVNAKPLILKLMSKYHEQLNTISYTQLFRTLYQMYISLKEEWIKKKKEDQIETLTTQSSSSLLPVEEDLNMDQTIQSECNAFFWSSEDDLDNDKVYGKRHLKLMEDQDDQDDFLDVMSRHGPNFTSDDKVMSQGENSWISAGRSGYDTISPPNNVEDEKFQRELNESAYFEMDLELPEMNQDPGDDTVDSNHIWKQDGGDCNPSKKQDISFANQREMENQVENKIFEKRGPDSSLFLGTTLKPSSRSLVQPYNRNDDDDIF